MSAPVLLSSGRWFEDFGGGNGLEWSGCECGEPTPCGIWLGSGRRNCEPPVCHCEDIDPDPPSWKSERARRSGESAVYICDSYIAKKGHWAGRWTNRCPCWGAVRDSLPEGCCAWHPWSPRYAPLQPGTSLPVLAPMHGAPVAGTGTYLDALDGRRPVEDAQASSAYADALGIPLDVAPAPYVRRWTREELHCDCPTPWDHMITKDGKVSEKGIGFHCVQCHCNFLNPGVAALHRRSILEPCRDPATIRDPERGTRVMRARDAGGMVVWS